MPRQLDREYEPYMQNIEWVVVQMYREQPTLTDYSVDRVYEALLKTYEAQQSGRSPRLPRLNDSEQRLFDQIKAVTDWQMAEAAPPPDQPYPPIVLGLSALSLDETIVILKQLRGSREFWTDSAGRQGYVHYINQFFAPT